MTPDEMVAYEAGKKAGYVMEEKYKKENDMDNSGSGVSYNASDLLGIQAMTSAGRGGGYGGGGGAWGGGYGGGSLYTGNNVLAAEAHANGTATKEAIDGNSDLIRMQANNFENGNRDRQFAATAKDASDNVQRICDRLSNIEINSLRDKADSAAALAACCCDTQKAIAEAAKEAAKCCCDAQLLAANNASDLQALVIKENSATRELMSGTALAAANAKISQLETINALDHRHR